MTFRKELKRKLIEAGYPVEISKFYANHRVRCLGRDIISENGIKIERERISEYRPSLRIDRYVEWVRIFTNGYIANDTIKDIVNSLFEKYVLPYNIIKLEVRIIDNTTNPTVTILNLSKGKNSSYFDLSEYDRLKIARC